MLVTVLWLQYGDKISRKETESIGHNEREKKDPCTHISCNISINQIDFEVLDHFLSPLTMCVINYAVEHIFVSVTHKKNTHRQPAA